MSSGVVFLLVYLLGASVLPPYSATSEESPTVLLAVLARSRAHMLPTYLAFIENLNYPKDMIAIYIQTDHNQVSSYNYGFLKV